MRNTAVWIDYAPEEKTMPSEDVQDAPLTLLLVENNLPHAELVKRALEAHQIVHRLYHVGDGEAALAYLFRQGGTLIRRRASGHTWCC
jgi:hypothetical protein